MAAEDLDYPSRINHSFSRPCGEKHLPLEGIETRMTDEWVEEAAVGQPVICQLGLIQQMPRVP